MLGGDERESSSVVRSCAKGREVRWPVTPPRLDSPGPRRVEAVVEAVRGRRRRHRPDEQHRRAGRDQAARPGARLVLDEAAFRAMGRARRSSSASPSPDRGAARPVSRSGWSRLAELDEMAILNSIPTAEGAISRAMQELPVTLHGSRAVVVGFGRCGITWRACCGGSARGCGGRPGPRRSWRGPARWVSTPARRRRAGEAVGDARAVFNTVPALRPHPGQCSRRCAGTPWSSTSLGARRHRFCGRPRAGDQGLSRPGHSRQGGARDGRRDPGPGRSRADHRRVARARNRRRGQHPMYPISYGRGAERCGSKGRRSAGECAARTAATKRCCPRSRRWSRKGLRCAGAVAHGGDHRDPVWHARRTSPSGSKDSRVSSPITTIVEAEPTGSKRALMFRHRAVHRQHLGEAGQRLDGHPGADGGQGDAAQLGVPWSSPSRPTTRWETTPRTSVSCSTRATSILSLLARTIRRRSQTRASQISIASPNGGQALQGRQLQPVLIERAKRAVR